MMYTNHGNIRVIRALKKKIVISRKQTNRQIHIEKLLNYTTNK